MACPEMYGDYKTDECFRQIFLPLAAISTVVWFAFWAAIARPRRNMRDLVALLAVAIFGGLALAMLAGAFGEGPMQGRGALAGLIWGLGTPGVALSIRHRRIETRGRSEAKNL